MSSSDKTLWVVGGGAETVPGVQRALAKGLQVIVSDYNPAAPAMALAHSAVVASTYDHEATLAAARDHLAAGGHIDGVICMATDVPYTVAYVAQGLGLPGLSLETARLSANKIQMKDRLRQAGIPVPDYGLIDQAGQLRDWVAEGREAVIKPVDSRGARGVLLLDQDSDLAWAFDHALAQSPSGQVMVERYIAGPQLSTEGLLVNKTGYPATATDRNYARLAESRPYVVEDGGSFPSHLSGSVCDAAAALTMAAGRALGIDSGVVKGDVVIGDNGPMIIEIACRLSGGYLSSHQIPLSTGIDLIGAAIDIALGEEPDKSALTPRHRRGVAIRYFFPKPGILREIRGMEAYENHPDVVLLTSYVAVGDRLADPTNHTQRAGFVLTKGGSAAAAIELAQEIVGAVSFVTDQTPPPV